MERSSSILLSKIWYITIMAVLVLLLVLHLSVTNGNSLSFWILQKQFETDNTTYTEWIVPVQTIIAVLTFCMNLLMAFFYGAMAMHTRKNNTILSIGFWLMVLINLAFLLLSFVSTIFGFVMKDSTLDTITSFNQTINIISIVLFVLQVMLLLVLGICSIFVGKGRMRTGGILVTVSALLYFFLLIGSHVLQPILASKGNVIYWYPTDMLFRSLAIILLFSGWGLMLKKSSNNN